MAFIQKEDYLGLSDDKLVCTASNDGASASVAEAKGQDGSVVASEVYGENLAPSCDYQLKGEWSRGSESPSPNPVKLGAVTTVGTKKICLSGLSISTSAGAAPTVSANGEQVADDATAACVYALPAFTLPKTHHAHILWDCATVGGAGCHLTAASYSASASVSKATKEGVVLTHDVVEGKIEAQLTIMQNGSAKPTVTPGEGWVVTGVLACSNPDADWPTWSCTLTKYLAK